MTDADPPVDRDALPAGPPLHLEVPGAVAGRLAPFAAPRRVQRLREVLARRTRHLAILTEHVHDPHNIAACARSCDAFGVQDLHVIPQDGVPVELHPVVAQGTQRWVTMRRHASTGAAVGALREAGYRIVATDLRPDPPPTPLDTLDLSQPTVVAFGNEMTGISEALRAAADERICIPLVGFVDSLNISVAVAITLHVLRTRLDATLGDAAALSADARLDLLDRWLLRDVPRAPEVLAELARRAALSPPGGSD